MGELRVPHAMVSRCHELSDEEILAGARLVNDTEADARRVLAALRGLMSVARERRDDA